MEQGYSLSNIFKNTTKKQKIWFGLALMIIVILLVILVFFVMEGGSTSENEGDDNVEQGNGVVNVTEDSYINDRGYTVTQKITTYADGSEVITETKMDKYGNVTTTDPTLITTYFPYQEMRGHKDSYSTLRYYVRVYEEDKTIEAFVEYCDEEQDKNLVYKYIDSVPIDLSEYTVKFEIADIYISCEE